MDLLDRLLGHDAWTTRQLLELCRGMSDADLDRPFDVGPGSLRATFVHVIRNLENWSGLMDGRVRTWDDVENETPERQTVAALLARLEVAAAALAAVARSVQAAGRLDETWRSELECPAPVRTYGGSIAHVITHSMHHRAQILLMLRRLGVDAPEGDVLSWEREIRSNAEVAEEE